MNGVLKTADELAKYGIPLATNQWEYSVIRRLPETEGMLQACCDRGTVFQSYSSLAQGRLNGKYTPDNEPPKTYRFSSFPMKDFERTVNILNERDCKRKVYQYKLCCVKLQHVQRYCAYRRDPKPKAGGRKHASFRVEIDR